MPSNEDPDTSPTSSPYNLRSRPTTTDKMPSPSADAAAAASTSTTSSSSGSSKKAATRRAARNSPYLPTPTETLALLAYPTLLVFGTLFSVLSPETRNAPYDPVRQAHAGGDAAPSYFARKDNLLNVLFVKRGWAWITVAFFAVAVSSSTMAATRGGTGRRGAGSPSTAAAAAGAGATRLPSLARAAARWALTTGWWILVTQWCFGPPLIDRGFRFTGGKCEVAADNVFEGVADKGDVFTSVACRAAGGKWSGGHDISGHVFLLVLGSYCLLQELGWPVLRRKGGRGGQQQGEERSVVMSDGAIKGAGVEAASNIGGGDDDDGEAKTAAGTAEATSFSDLDWSTKFAMVVVGLCWWMLLMTAIYFHTWFEKFTGLVTAMIGIYAVYIVPRFVPALRAFVGLPGI